MRRRLSTVILVIFFLVVVLFAFREEIKQRLPRFGAVLISGGVYSPFLTPNTPLYFLKHFDEASQLFFLKNQDDVTKYYIELANKRVLELEEISRNSNGVVDKSAIKAFEDNENLVYDSVEESYQKGELSTDVVLILVQTHQDQQKIFSLLLEQWPSDSSELNLLSEHFDQRYQKVMNDVQSLDQLTEIEKQTQASVK